MFHKTLKIHPKDNVWVALRDLNRGENIDLENGFVKLVQDVPAKHKYAESAILKGENIYMYGVIVGKAVHDIPAGGILTTENVTNKSAEYGAKKETITWEAPDVSKYKGKTFLGYHRSDGQVGTANYWLVIPLVFCENRNVYIIKDAFMEELGFSKPNPYKSIVKQMVKQYAGGNLNNIDELTVEQAVEDTDSKIFDQLDGIKFLTHEGGCGGIRQDSEALCALFAGYINNPNVAGATVLSLGCQNAQVTLLMEKLQAINFGQNKPLIVLEQQKEGTEKTMLTKAIKQTFLAMVEANKTQRAPAPLSKLKLGLECGGSDGFSGISANPSVGHASDLLAALGGSAILSEFPELCGVEQELINRCENVELANKFEKLIRTYEASAEAVGSGFDMNPSPGNIRDGLITDAMKSAGASKKGGTSTIVDVLDYTEQVTKPGLNLLCTPGNDVESTTALAGSGANIILFTTGLGTPTGNPVAPVIKISSNTKMAEKMADIIDVNTGEVITGEKTIEEMGEQLLDFIIEVASGRIKTKAMILGQDDFIPWKRGVSL
jgi:altronate hydrolase